MLPHPSMRSKAPLLSSLCPFLVFPWPRCPVSPLEGTEVSGTECSPALGQPQFCSRLPGSAPGPRSREGREAGRNSASPGMAGRCQGLWLDSRMGALLPNGVTPVRSGDLWLGHSNLTLAWPGQVFPLLGLLVPERTFSLSPIGYFFGARQCPRTLSLAWRKVAMYPGNLTPLDPILSDVPAAGLAWSLDHQARSSESLPRGWAWPACLLPTSPHTGWSLHFLNSPQHCLASFPPAPERALSSWWWVVADVAQADSDGRVGMAGSSPGWHQRG